jgi:HNH endonuclease
VITCSALSGDRFRAGKRLWSRSDDKAMRQIYPHLSTTEVARRLRRSVQAIYARADILNLRKSETYLASPEACRLRRGDNVGARFRYEKGHIPANKGLRRPGWSAGRMKETQFKKGMRSGKAAEHVMTVGSTRLVEGYVYVKVSEVPNVPYTVNWKAQHHLIWTQAYGPIPRGCVLIFRNGDRLDVRLDNLECVSRRALMARNTIHNLPPALARTIQLLGALNRQIRTRSAHGAQQDR